MIVATIIIIVSNVANKHHAQPQTQRLASVRSSEQSSSSWLIELIGGTISPPCSLLTILQSDRSWDGDINGCSIVDSNSNNACFERKLVPTLDLLFLRQRYKYHNPFQIYTTLLITPFKQMPKSSKHHKCNKRVQSRATKAARLFYRVLNIWVR